jgi:chromosome segregation ATPase
LEAEKAVTLSSKDPGNAPKDVVSSALPADVTIQLKSDLAEALRAKGQLQSRLKFAEDELDKLRVKTKTDTKLIKDLYAERAGLITKVKDRDEELKGKAKLLEVTPPWFIWIC